MKSGLLISQIGYDLHSPMRVVFRATERSALDDAAVIKILPESNLRAGEREMPWRYWGECWGDHWWCADFTGLPTGDYTASMVETATGASFREPFVVARHRLWDQTVSMVGVEQFEERARRARAQTGWKDCGSTLRELCSHASSILGLCELVLRSTDWLASDDYRRLLDQIVHGCDYLAACQNKAEDLGLPFGSFVHELTHSPNLVPADAAQGGLALAMASRLVFESHPQKSQEFIKRARATYAFLQTEAAGFPPDGFSALNHGAPDDFLPAGQLMTRELLMRMWFAVEMWISGGDKRHQDDAVGLAREILERQIPAGSDGSPELHGHFRTFPDAAFAEKSNVHHHVGHDTGAIFPSPIMPFFEMIARWTDHADCGRWQKAVRDFGYGYFLPASRRNPFLLMPSGDFGDEGILTFCGPWHGINVSYAWWAILACRLEGATGDAEFRGIAVANLQWIAGLNAGLAEGMFESCIGFHPDIPPDRFLPFSMIEGIGHRSVKGWSDIKGSIVNGFSVNPQFHLTEPATRENDRPREFTDEDWIPPAAAWVAALASLREIQFYHDSKMRQRSGVSAAEVSAGD